MNTSSSFIKGKIFLVLNSIRIRSSHLYNEKFDWLFLVDPIWLVWNTYISHSLTDSVTTSLTHWLTDSLTHWLTDSLTYPRPITYSTRRLRGIFLQKNNSKSIKFPFDTKDSKHLVGRSGDAGFVSSNFIYSLVKNKCRITLCKCNLIKSDFQRVRGFLSLSFYFRWSSVVLCKKGKLTTRMKCGEISWALLAKIPLRGWVRELCMCACHTKHNVGCIKQRIKLPVRK